MRPVRSLHHHARPAGELGVGNCGKARASLVATSHEIDLVALVQSVNERKKAHAGHAKCPVGTVRDQSIYDEIGDSKSRATQSRLERYHHHAASFTACAKSQYSLRARA
jgi:hypothetical protein